MSPTWFWRTSVVMAIAVCTLSAAIAIQTTFNRHPDELVHVDAFCYFRTHAWPPPPNAEGLVYGPDGISRVYYGELVYWLWGRLDAFGSAAAWSIRDFGAGVWRQAQVLDRASQTLIFLPAIAMNPGCVYPVQTYRIFNTALLAFTLLVLLYFARGHPWVMMVLATLLCVPQVIYVYSYANSDAWGLSASVFLFVYVIVQPAPLRSVRATLLLGVLTALVLLAKQSFWVALPFAYFWILYRRVPRDPAAWLGALRQRAAHLFFLVLVVLGLISPLQIIYPLSIPNYAERLVEMREQRAWVEFRPSNPTYPSFRWSARGIPFAAVWRNPGWYTQSLTSLYGQFGYLSEALPRLQYMMIALLAASFIALTYGFAIVRRRLLPPMTRVALIVAPCFIGLTVLASLYNSWTYDFQAQGRYLFAALLPLALLLGGAYAIEPAWSQRVRFVGWLVACGLCLLALYRTVLTNPNLLP